MQYVEHFFLFEDTEEAVKQDLEPYRYSLCTIKHEAADVKYYVRLYDLHLCWVVQVLSAEFVQSCSNREKKNKKISVLKDQSIMLITCKWIFQATRCKSLSVLF